MASDNVDYPSEFSMVDEHGFFVVTYFPLRLFWLYFFILGFFGLILGTLILNSNALVDFVYMLYKIDFYFICKFINKM